MKGKVQMWWAGLVLTLAAMAAVIVVAMLVIAYLVPVLGAGAYVVVLAFAAVLSLLVGRVVRWLASG